MKPQIIDQVTFAFPAKVEHLMPDNKKYPEYQKYLDNWRDDTWGFKLFNDWFYPPGITDLKLWPKEGINPEEAIRHIQTIMRSFEPKHEHKTAACAFLFELWFDKAEWKRK